MACFTVSVSITYRAKGATGSGNTVTRTSSCLPSPFSTVLDRSADGFFLNYNGGREILEGSWTNYDLLSSSIVSQTSCTECNDPTVSYDCINASCVKKTVYNTPGIYQSLSDCETACGIGCSGKCLSNEEWSRIQDLANKLRQRNCS